MPTSFVIANPCLPHYIQRTMLTPEARKVRRHGLVQYGMDDDVVVSNVHQADARGDSYYFGAVCTGCKICASFRTLMPMVYMLSWRLGSDQS